MKEIMAYIGLNILSVLLFVLNIAAGQLSRLPSWVAWLLVLSVVFLNISKGISYLRKNKSYKGDETKPEE